MENNKITEEPSQQDSPQLPPLQGEASYDYVVSEAAVGQIKGIPFTLGSFRRDKNVSEEAYFVKMDIDKKEFVDIREGQVVKLGEGVEALVVKIEHGGGHPRKGKVYFKVISD